MTNIITPSRINVIFGNLFRLVCAFLLASLTIGGGARAEDTLEILVTGSGDRLIPIIVPVFEKEGSLPNSVSEVVRADLERSGLFRLISISPMTLPESPPPDLPAMMARGADAVVAASVTPVRRAL